jgi:Gpi18-like mannosyltransferase
MTEAEMDPPGTRPPGWASLRFSFAVPAIWPLLVIGLILRLGLAFMPGFGVDIGAFHAWSLRLADIGPWDFYEPGYFADYAPGYLYVLWFIGELNEIFKFGPDTYEYILKLPSIIADIGSAYLLYRFLEGRREDIRLGAAAIYLFFPAALLIGAVWGQVDSLGAFFLLLSIYLISRDRPLPGALAFVVGFVIKPQMIAALPFLAFWIIRDYPRGWLRSGLPDIRKALQLWLTITAAGFALMLLLILAFFPDNPLNFIDQLRDSANFYEYNSLNAYNFWSVDGFFRPDTGDWQSTGISQYTWGIILFAIASVAVIAVLRDRREDWALALGSALCLLAFYLFLTRMHERYLFPFFLPFLIACVLAQSRALWAVFVVLGVIHFLDLYFAYSYYPFVLPPEGTAPDEPFFRPMWDLITDLDILGTGLEGYLVLSIAATLCFPVLLAITLRLPRRKRPAEAA